MAKRLPESINLLNPMNPPSDVWTVSFEWLSSVGRYLMVAVNIVVLIAFFTRFVLDAKNNDLTTEINNKVALLATPEFQQEEKYYLNLNVLLKDLKILSSNQQINSVVVMSVLDSLPTDVKLRSFQYLNGSITVSFTAPTFDVISNYESDLEANPNYTNVLVAVDKDKSIENVGNVGANISFDIADDRNE